MRWANLKGIWENLWDLPYLLMVFPPLFWAGNFVIGRSVRGEIPPISLNFWRWTLAGFILGLFFAKDVIAARRIIIQHWKVLSMLAATGIFFFHSGTYIGLTSTTAINATLIIALGPVLVIPVSWLVLGTSITAKQGIGVLLSCMGVAIILLQGQFARLEDFTFNKGDIWVLFASVSWSFYSVLLKRRPQSLSPSVMLVVIIWLGVFFNLPFFIYELSQGKTFALNLPNLSAIAYVVVFAAILAYFAWNRGVALIGPNRGALFLHLMPVFSTILSVVFLGERLFLYHLGGFVLIVLGLYLNTFAARSLVEKNGGSNTST